MPGQEKIVMDYYQKNPSAADALRGTIYEDKIMQLIKSKAKINKKEITFDVYQRASEKPIYRISKNLNPKSTTEKFYVLDRNGKIVKKSENLDNLINKIEWTKLRVVR